MNTLNLFLKNAGGENVELVHQRILWWLFHSPTVVREVLKVEVVKPKVEMEAYEKLFDLQINDDGIEKVLIELKMWSTFGKTQIRDQFDHIKKKSSKSKLVYILFGISYLEKADSLEGALVIGVEGLSKILLKLSDRTNSFFKELNNEEIGECTSSELKQFLITYAIKIKRTNDWLINEAWKEKISTKNKAKVYASLFNQVKIGLIRKH